MSNTTAAQFEAIKTAAAKVMQYDRSLWAAKLAGLSVRWPKLAMATALYIAELEG